jgi:hypothetical protein
MDDDEYTRNTPPEETEWHKIWASVERSNKAWLIVGPIHAVATNWKFLLGAVAAAAWFNRPEITQALTVILGGAP